MVIIEDGGYIKLVWKDGESAPTPWEDLLDEEIDKIVKMYDVKDPRKKRK